MSDQRVEEIDAQIAPEKQLRAMYAIERACLLEMTPGDPVRDADEAIASYRHPESTSRRFHWLAGEAGSASLVVYSLSAVFLQLYVAPAHRRQGIGTALFEAARRRSAELEVIALYGKHATDAGASFAHHVGAIDGAREVISVLDFRVSDLPVPQTPEGWSLPTWIGRVPDEHVAAYARARAAMDEAPHPEEMEFPAASVERIRASEESLARRGREMRVTVALAGGEVAAFTELRLSPGGAAGFTDDTGTLAPYRGRGLATAVKLESLRGFRAAHPGVDLVTTSNDETNTAMLSINRKLGFVPVAIFTRAQLAFGPPR